MSVSARCRMAGLLSAVTVTVVGLFGAGIAVAVPAAAAPAQSAAHGVSGPRLTKLVEQARKLTTEHIPYSKGGHGAQPAPLGSSVDCSGMVRSLYYWAFGVDIGQGSGDSSVRMSGRFARTTHPVPGDVALLGHGGSAPAYHAMVYVGNDGGRRTAVGSPDFGEYIKYQYPESAYWKGDLMGYWHYKGATAADSGPITAAPVPTATGAITGVTIHANTVEIKGWAVDRAQSSATNRIVLVIDGKQVYGGVAKRSGHFPYSGPHGFDVELGATVGAHTVTLTSVGKRSTAGLTPHKFTVPPPATGAITAVTATKNRVEIKGWAVDRANPAASNQIVLVIDGKQVYGGVAKGSGPSPYSGRHGFDVMLGASRGHHTVSLTSVGKRSTAGLSPHTFVV